MKTDMIKKSKILFCSLFFLFLIFLLPGADKKTTTSDNELFATGEKYFAEGKYQEAEEKLAAYIATQDISLKSDKIIKASAMMEYIARKKPEYIENILKRASDFSKLRSPGTEQTIQTMKDFLLILKDWKANERKEWLELSDYLLEILKKTSNETDSIQSLKLLVYRSELLALRNENRECATLIENALTHYFKSGFEIMKLARDERDTAFYLMNILADQYFAIAMRSENRSEKEKNYSLAGTTFIKIYPAAERGTAQYTDIIGKIIHVRQALALLNVKLIVPKELEMLDMTSSYPLMNEMLFQKRFSGLLKAVEAEFAKGVPTPKGNGELLFLKINALNGLGKHTECANLIAEKRNDLPSGNINLMRYLDIAEQLKNLSLNEDALKIYIAVSNMSYDKAELEKIYINCANISILINEYDNAVSYFRKAAKESSSFLNSSAALENAARIMYNAKTYKRAFELSDEALKILPVEIADSEFKIPLKILNIQSALELGNYILAEKRLQETLFLNEKLDNDSRGKILLLSALTADKQNKLEEADRFYVMYLRENQSCDSFFIVLCELGSIRFVESDKDKLIDLCNIALESHAASSDTRNIIMLSGDRMLEKNKFDDAYFIYEKLAECTSYDLETLNEIMKKFSNSKYNYSRRKYDSLLCKIISSNLPDFSSDSKTSELYLNLAKLNFSLDNNDKALELVNILRSEKKIYKIIETNMLYASILNIKKEWNDAISVWRELMLLSNNGNRFMRSQIVVNYAKCLMMTNKYTDALAAAYLNIPADEKMPLDKKYKEIISESLDIISLCAEKLNSLPDIEDSKRLRETLFLQTTK